MIIKENYRAHPCRIGRAKFPSIQAAAQWLGLPYPTVWARFTRGEAGYVLLPYDGILPSSSNRQRQPPHIYAEGNWYSSQAEAGKALGVSQTTVGLRIADRNMMDYFVMLA